MLKPLDFAMANITLGINVFLSLKSDALTKEFAYWTEFQ